MDGTQGHLVDVCSCAVPPITDLLSTLSTSCELSHDWPPDSTSFSVAHRPPAHAEPQTGEGRWRAWADQKGLVVPE